MMKRMMALLMALLVFLPVTGLADVSYQVYKEKYLEFPELGGWRGRFNSMETWTIVTASNLEENMELVKGRGESEEAIRERFAEETLVFEAYSELLPKDVCIRFERYENSFTQAVWQLSLHDSGERKALTEDVSTMLAMHGYDLYSPSVKSKDSVRKSGDNMYIACSFTNFPPDVYEGGNMQIHFRNGVMYVLSSNVRGRSRLSLTGKEKRAIDEKSPMNGSSYRGDLLPRMAEMELDESIPVQVDVGKTVTVSGTIEKGSALEMTVDGKPVEVQVDKKNRFTASLPMNLGGDHEVTLKLTHEKYTTYEDSFIINASASRTPLTLTRQPEVYATAGKQTFAGTTDPGTILTIQLDEGEMTVIPVESDGSFEHTFTLSDSMLHTVQLKAKAPDKDALTVDLAFVTLFESVKDGIKVFEKKLTDKTMPQMSRDPEGSIGERVKISVRVHEITYSEQGLGLMCTWNANKSYKGDPIYLYLTLPGYSNEAQIGTNMIMTVYGTMQGPHSVNNRKGEPVDGMEVFVEYGTYFR